MEQHYAYRAALHQTTAFRQTADRRVLTPAGLAANSLHQAVRIRSPPVHVDTWTRDKCAPVHSIPLSQVRWVRSCKSLQWADWRRRSAWSTRSAAATRAASPAPAPAPAAAPAGTSAPWCRPTTQWLTMTCCPREAAARGPRVHSASSPSPNWTTPL